MKCKIKHCTDLAVPGYECCDFVHGLMLKRAREILSDLSRANMNLGLAEWNWYFDNPPTVEDYELYELH